VDTSRVNDEAKRATDELAQIIATRQYVDWRDLRTEPLTSPQVVRKLSQLGSQIRDALDRVLEAEATVPTPTLVKVEPHATESARQKAQELGVNLSQVEGSGAGGGIVVKDVVSAAPQKRPAQEPPPVTGVITEANAQRIRSLRTLEGPRRWKPRKDGVNSVAFSPDGLLLASGSDDSTVILWRVEDGQLLRELKGHKDGYVFSVAFSPEGKVVASGLAGTIEPWWSDRRRWGMIQLWGIP